MDVWPIDTIKPSIGKPGSLSPCIYVHMRVGVKDVSDNKKKQSSLFYELLFNGVANHLDSGDVK
jgi:hypothetical protein